MGLSFPSGHHPALAASQPVLSGRLGVSLPCPHPIACWSPSRNSILDPLWSCEVLRVTGEVAAASLGLSDCSPMNE